MLTDTATTQAVLDVVGVFVFALSGAVVAVRRGLDLFGILVLAWVAGLGGGIIRDLFLGITPPVAVSRLAAARRRGRRRRARLPPARPVGGALRRRTRRALAATAVCRAPPRRRRPRHLRGERRARGAEHGCRCPRRDAHRRHHRGRWRGDARRARRAGARGAAARALRAARAVRGGARRARRPLRRHLAVDHLGVGGAGLRDPGAGRGARPQRARRRCGPPAPCATDPVSRRRRLPRRRRRPRRRCRSRAAGGSRPRRGW